MKGRLKGKGTLGTLVLCDSLLSFLLSGSTPDHPHRLLKEYEVMALAI